MTSHCRVADGRARGEREEGVVFGVEGRKKEEEDYRSGDD
jgi:hypothetical protein